MRAHKRNSAQEKGRSRIRQWEEDLECKERAASGGERADSKAVWKDGRMQEEGVESNGCKKKCGSEEELRLPGQGCP